MDDRPSAPTIRSACSVDISSESLGEADTLFFQPGDAAPGKETNGRDAENGLAQGGHEIVVFAGHAEFMVGIGQDDGLAAVIGKDDEAASGG